MRRLARWIIAGGALLGLLPDAGPARAAPQVEIKAQTTLSVEKVRRSGDDGVAVSGHLVDKLTNEPIGNQVVLIELGGEVARATTDPDGRFSVMLSAVPHGPQPLALRFAGGDQLDRAELRTTTDPTRAQVSLALRAEDAPGGATIHVVATVDDQPSPLPVRLFWGLPTDAQLAPLATITAGKPFALARAQAGGPGPRRIRASFDGDENRQSATAEATIELTTSTTTTLAVSSTRLAYEDDLVATGKVTDEDGKPVARAAVALTAGDRRLAQGVTTPDGSYRFELEAEILGQGQFGIQVQTDPGASYIRASRSSPVVVKIAAPQPVPVSYTIAAFLATALAAGGFFLARSKPWRRLRRAAPPAEAPAAEVAHDPTEGGLVLHKQSIVSSLRRAHDDGFSGSVRDSVRGRPIGNATIRLALGDATRALRTDDDGNFLVEGLAAGEWRAEVAAPGHVTERFTVAIPHRG
ncbi:MAG: carboxypeptidase regulatory-like domain-containing protein, partial [Kofleriaceae bacterium]